MGKLIVFLSGIFCWFRPFRNKRVKYAHFVLFCTVLSLVIYEMCDAMRLSRNIRIREFKSKFRRQDEWTIYLGLIKLNFVKRNRLAFFVIWNFSGLFYRYPHVIRRSPLWKKSIPKICAGVCSNLYFDVMTSNVNGSYFKKWMRNHPRGLLIFRFCALLVECYVK